MLYYTVCQLKTRRFQCWSVHGIKSIHHKEWWVSFGCHLSINCEVRVGIRFTLTPCIRICLAIDKSGGGHTGVSKWSRDCSECISARVQITKRQREFTDSASVAILSVHGSTVELDWLCLKRVSYVEVSERANLVHSRSFKIVEAIILEHCQLIWVGGFGTRTIERLQLNLKVVSRSIHILKSRNIFAEICNAYQLRGYFVVVSGTTEKVVVSLTKEHIHYHCLKYTQRVGFECWESIVNLLQEVKRLAKILAESCRGRLLSC